MAAFIIARDVELVRSNNRRESERSYAPTQRAPPRGSHGVLPWTETDA